MVSVPNRLKVRNKPQIKFEVVDLTQVPSKTSKARPVSFASGSQWDDALKTLKRRRGIAIKIVEENPYKRGQLKSTLQTIAKNRYMFVEIRDFGPAIFAWVSKRSGRYSPLA